MSTPAPISAPVPATSEPSENASGSDRTDRLHTLIPRLNPDGTNWAMFRMCFEEAMDTTGRWGYFDGTEMRPVPVDNNNVTEEEKEATK